MGKILLHKYTFSLRMDATESSEKHFFPIVLKYDLIHQHAIYLLEVICLQNLSSDYKNIYIHLIMYTESLLLSGHILRGGYIHRREQINCNKGAYVNL